MLHPPPKAAVFGIPLSGTLMTFHHAGKGQVPIGWSQHKSDFPHHRISLVHEGRAAIELLNGRKITLESGSIYLLPAWEPASRRADKNFLHSWVNFSGPAQSVGPALAEGFVFSSNEASPGIEKVFSPLYELSKEKDHPKLSLILKGSSAILHLLSFVIPDKPSDLLSLDPRVMQLRDFILHNPHERINLQDWAIRVALDPVYFANLFKRKFGLSPLQWQLEIRIENAKKLLWQGFAIKDVTKAIGYDDVNYFSRLFRTKTGISPGQFRLLNRKGR